ncbi:MAG TPA: arsenate reductase ArsC [bacterium]|nr:arsenate reductase ArsC [bacterium]HOM26696.1 arsenate reductase ArsC [bacterium]
MKKILFLCRENSARSQIAEGIVNYFYKDNFIAFSAGSIVKFVHPLAIEVMKEIGIDISNHRSKSIKEFLNEEFDYVITVCVGDKKGLCPFFPGKTKKTIAWEIPDPAEKNEIEGFRKVRDILKRKIDDFISKEEK